MSALTPLQRTTLSDIGTGSVYQRRFGSGSMAARETPEQAMLSALQEIMRDYENVDISHVDFRVRAARVASGAITKACSASEGFPQPQRRDGKEPCGECRLPVGETCDICGASA